MPATSPPCAVPNAPPRKTTAWKSGAAWNASIPNTSPRITRRPDARVAGRSGLLVPVAAPGPGRAQQARAEQRHAQRLGHIDLAGGGVGEGKNQVVIIEIAALSGHQVFPADISDAHPR